MRKRTISDIDNLQIEVEPKLIYEKTQICNLSL